MKAPILGLTLALLALAPGLAADPVASPGPATLKPASLTDVAWMAGTWRAETPDGSVTETWLGAEGGVMPGIGRTVKAGKAQVEFMRIDEKDGWLGFTAIVGGQAPVSFPAKTIGPGEVLFENPAHDFPQRIAYRRCGLDLCAAIEGTMGGRPERIEWRYRRAP